VPSDLLQIPEGRQRAIERITPVLRDARTVAITTHVNADGDACGSAAAMTRLLKQLGIRAHVVNPTPWPALFAFLLGNDVEDRTALGAAALRNVDALLVLDVSGSMHRILSEMAQVGQRSLGVLQEQDQVGVQFFARSSRLAIELTDDKLAAARLLKDALLEDSLGAGSSVYEALLAAADVLSEAPEARGRRAVLMLTDNGGLSYQLPATDVLKELYQVNAVVNAIVPEKTKEPAAPKPGEYRNPDFEPHNIFQIAAQTGGEVVRADNSGRFREIIEHIRMRYSLHYRPLPAPPGSFRRVQVELASETRRKYPKAEVLARAGYFAP